MKEKLWLKLARKIVQFCCFLLFNAVVFGLGPWPILLPVLESLGAPSKTVGEALGALQLMLYELSLGVLLALASIFLTATLFGRFLCGWACPFGFVQDLLGYIKRRHTRISLHTHKLMTKAKYGILAIVLFVSGTLSASLASGSGQNYKDALGVFAPAPFNALSPADTLFGIIPRIVFAVYHAILTMNISVFEEILSVPVLLWFRLVIMVIIMASATYIPRSWCRYFCPQGAFLALLSRFSFIGLKRDPVKCTKVGCRGCVDVCPMMVRILDLPWEKFTDPECIYCLKCVEACSENALKLKFP
jgi:ferredoxin-type protein NapH